MIVCGILGLQLIVLPALYFTHYSFSIANGGRIGWRSSEQFAVFATEVSGSSKEAHEHERESVEAMEKEEQNNRTEKEAPVPVVPPFREAKNGDKPHGPLNQVKIDPSHIDESKEVNETADASVHEENPLIDRPAAGWRAPDWVAARPKRRSRVPDGPLTFADDLDADLFDVDYSVSHPLDNACHEPDLLPFVQHFVKAECKKPKQPTLIEQLPGGEILIHPRFKTNSSLQFKCYYQELTGAIQPDNKNFDFKGDMKELPLNRRFFVELDQFYVECRSRSGKIISSDAFTNIPSKERLKPPRLDGTPNISVSILVLDSTSRNQFFRHAPLTLRFMRENGFLVLNGYNKVNDNSAVNLTPLLAGKSFDTKYYGTNRILRKDMVIGDKDVHYDFWEHADMIGFKRPPADYFFRPYYMHLYKKHYPEKLCINGQLGQLRFLQNWERFATKYARTCHFGFSFLTALTHDDANYLEMLDEAMYNALIRLKEAGVFDNTLMIVMGDHGQRMSDIQKTYSGRIEERMPMFGVRFPQKFREQHLEKVHNYHVNTNRLVSNFDLHETLREALGLNPPDRRPVGLSLFHPIPRNRTCFESRIPYHHCTCQQRLDQNLVPADIKTRLMAGLNSYLEAARPLIQCVREVVVSPAPAFQPFTINAHARAGIRAAHDMLKKTRKERAQMNAATNAIFDVEFDVPVRLLPADSAERGAEEREFSFQLRTRGIWNRYTNYTRLIAKPLLRKSPEKCADIRILEDVCRCINQ
ncbi:hypothetical protein M3Y99_00640200 [Aphelenchoides fujianensis]|nr:hypothetical protein M3Y99_00640200 [Aphelenchoides fujianensis]